MEEQADAGRISSEAIESLRKFTDEGLERVEKIVDLEIGKLEKWKEHIEKERSIRLDKPE
jgi:galactokinase